MSLFQPHFPLPNRAKSCMGWFVFQECRVTKPDPEPLKIVLIVSMAALFPFAIVVYAIQIFIASRCFTKSYWSIF